MLNIIIITGHICTDPTKVNDRLTIFRIANNGYKKDDANTLFIQVNCWDKLGEHAIANLHRGSFVTIKGRLQVRTYLDKDEVRKTSFEIVADAIDFLDRKKEPDRETPPPPINYDEMADDMLDDDWVTEG